MPNKKYKAVKGKTITSRQKKVMDLQDENLSNEDILNKMQNKGMTQKEGKIKKTSGINMGSPLYGKISSACKAAAKKKFKVWPSAYASGWGVRCTKAGGPSNYGGGKKK